MGGFNPMSSKYLTIKTVKYHKLLFLPHISEMKTINITCTFWHHKEQDHDFFKIVMVITKTLQSFNFISLAL